ncbi:hypothetical protein [Paraferrimonas sedimenticola]|uniref:Uncharacterized protein n=1 Tax=Paraferrimonas sedimenticola TaxID=375674 RepID=A0AA37RZP7_9GAMM|nr:hypothetical protein [Paraferrimonas sedimenticola]GLP97612.1 hypothetical protein GCM10007895_29190 [Paraferrimonas sedimenticola]
MNVVYFDTQYTYHIDVLLGVYSDKVIGLPDVPNGGLFTPLPQRYYDDYTVLKIPAEEQKKGVCNAIPTRNGGVIIIDETPKTQKLSKEVGLKPRPIPFKTVYGMTGSGPHCSCTAFWRET